MGYWHCMRKFKWAYVKITVSHKLHCLNLIEVIFIPRQILINKNIIVWLGKLLVLPWKVWILHKIWLFCIIFGISSTHLIGRSCDLSLFTFRRHIQNWKSSKYKIDEIWREIKIEKFHLIFKSIWACFSNISAQKIQNDE